MPFQLRQLFLPQITQISPVLLRMVVAVSQVPS